jgi:hypothetical protein
VNTPRNSQTDFNINPSEVEQASISLHINSQIENIYEHDATIPDLLNIAFIQDTSINESKDICCDTTADQSISFLSQRESININI